MGQVYSGQRRVATFDLKTADMASSGGYADNTDLFSIIVPANREISIYALKADVRLAGGAGSKIELVDSSNTVLASVATSATGIVTDSTSDFPLTFTNDTTSATKLKLRVDGSLDSTTDLTVEVHLDEPGV